MDEIQQKAVFEGVFKTAISAIPVAGGLINETIFDYRNRVKQDRYNKFLEEFMTYIRDVGGLSESDIQTIYSEDFLDIFESAARRAIRFKSQEKRKRFAKILSGYLKTPFSIEFTETFFSLIEVLGERQIEILAYYNDYSQLHEELPVKIIKLKGAMSSLEIREREERKKNAEGLANNWLIAKKDLEEAQQELENKLAKSKKLKSLEKPLFNDLSEGQYQFLIQDLYSKGLLLDVGLGAIQAVPFKSMSITEFGKAFLEFIEE